MFLPYKDAKLKAHVVLQMNCHFALLESILAAVLLIRMKQLRILLR